MSLLNIAKLNDTINEKNIIRPDLILNNVRDEIIKALNPEGAEVESKDGMDAALCSFDLGNMELEFALAYNPLWLIRNGALTEYRPDKMPVGLHFEKEVPFTLHKLALQKGDIIYTFTDGYADQFGGAKGKKFKYKQLGELLLKNSSRSMKEQKDELEKRFNDWKGSLEQVDDVLIIGVRI